MPEAHDETHACPECGLACAPEARFCSACGAALVPPVDDAAPEPAVTETPAEPELTEPDLPCTDPTGRMPRNILPPSALAFEPDDDAQDAPIVCRCGESLPAQARFCLRCGRRLDAAASLRLVCVRGNGRTDTCDLSGDPCVVGADAACEARIANDGYVSRRHARLSLYDGLLMIEDLASANGTFLRVCRPTAVEPGDEFIIGSTVLRIEEASHADR